MATLLIVFSTIACLLLLTNLLAELKRDLMMFQQNTYRPERYRRWLDESKDTTSTWRLVALVIFFFGLSPFCNRIVLFGISAIFAVCNIVSLSRRKYKLPLKWTRRATRIFCVASGLGIGIAAGFAFLWEGGGNFISATTIACESLLGCYCGSHLLIIVANFLLKPLEKSISQSYYNDAKRILRSMPDLKIIGITGSYGKTSTKHFLHRILSEQFDTLMTPGNFNTTLGVVRTVREHLKPYNEVFIVEMGAKNIGDIKEICDLVKPTVGIITAVGPQHLESFKTIDNVCRTKFELADAIPENGSVIVNNDFPIISKRNVGNCHCERYAVKSDAPWKAVDVKYSSQGCSFTVIGPDGFSLPLQSRLMGEANVSDLLAAVVCARLLGVPDSRIAAAVASIEPVEHRLSITRAKGGITILDDAYNSNPVGSRMAVEVLGTFKDGKRIVITPGMIELGDKQEELNKDFGRAIASNADLAIIVGKYNREAIVGGLHDVGFPEENIIAVDTLGEARARLAEVVTPGDTVLYENDLPDTFK